MPDEFASLLERLERRRADPLRRTSLSSRNRECGGLYPAASREVIDDAETTLGFPLPPLLRQIYGELANGGFGPGAGILGLEDGYSDPDLFDLSLVDYHRQFRESFPESPKHLLVICSVGCGDTYAVDCARSDYPVILMSPARSVVSTFYELMNRWADGKD